MKIVIFFYLFFVLLVLQDAAAAASFVYDADEANTEILIPQIDERKSLFGK